MGKREKSEGMKAARLIMILSSISPLFILWTIKGNKLIPDAYFIIIFIIMVIFPNVFLLLRVRTAIKLHEIREITIGSAEDHREHLLVYLFAMLLPIYSAEISSYRELGAVLAALAFIVFLFWHLNLHYMNLIFAVKGYHIFTVYPPVDDNPFSDKASQILITRRAALLRGEQLVTYRLSDTVFLEEEK